MKHSVCGALLAVSLVGCATPPKDSEIVAGANELPRVETVYANKLTNLKPGTSTGVFKALFPHAYIAGVEGEITKYEFDYTQRYVRQTDMTRQNWLVGFGSPNPHTYTQTLEFYFSGDQLQKWAVRRGDIVRVE